MSEYLSYCRPDTVARVLGQFCDHWAGDQLVKVRPGDHLWIVTFDEKLFLCGHMVVADVVSRREAERRLGTDDLWEAKYHALATPGHRELIRRVDISSRALELRFQGGRDRLPSDFSASNLQTMRLLSPESTALLRKEWYPRSAKGLWDTVRQEAAEAEKKHPFVPQDMEDCRLRTMREIVSRQGQQAFRNSLLEAYDQRCAISGCEVVEILEAAHIYPYNGNETNQVANGLLLRADLHTLFDLGLLGVVAVDADTYQVILSPTLLNSEYKTIAGMRLQVPLNPTLRPSIEALDWHRKEIAKL